MLCSCRLLGTVSAAQPQPGNRRWALHAQVAPAQQMAAALALAEYRSRRAVVATLTLPKQGMRVRTWSSKPPSGLVRRESRPTMGRPPCTCLPILATLSMKPLHGCVGLRGRLLWAGLRAAKGKAAGARATRRTLKDRGRAIGRAQAAQRPHLHCCAPRPFCRPVRKCGRAQAWRPLVLAGPHSDLIAACVTCRCLAKGTGPRRGAQPQDL